jgi:hypothetical protein
MASLDMVKTRYYLRKGVIGQVGDDLPVLLKIRYIGTGTVTSVTVTTATDITFITSDGGTDAYTWADYTTVGALAAAINKDGIFEARVMDCLSTTATGAGLAIDGAITADSLGEYNLLSDTSNADFLAYRLTYDRTFGTNSKLRMGHRVNIQEIVTDLTLGGGADSNSFKIYDCTPSGNSAPYSGAETLIYQKTPTSGSVSTTTWASGNAKISSSEGNDLLVIIADATSVTGTITIAGELE